MLRALDVWDGIAGQVRTRLDEGELNGSSHSAGQQPPDARNNARNKGRNKGRSKCAFKTIGLAVAVSLGLAACGGGGDDTGGRNPPPAASECSISGQQRWLADYMDEWYFWYRLSPRPAPSGFADVASYFSALLYTGGDPRFPADRYSFSESTESFNRFYGDGATLGYGMAVAGLEVLGQPAQPLWVRAVEPGSPAAIAGVQRGDQVLSLNGRSSSDVIGSDDFSALTPQQAGDRLSLQLRRNGFERSVQLSAAIHALVPVGASNVFTSSNGRRVGYVAIKNMIGQAEAPIATAFENLRLQGVSDLVLDLRYNGGGLVSVGNTLASYVAGLRGQGRVFTDLLYNDRRSAINNQRYTFFAPSASLGLARVYVLAGPRTCSAAEQVINGLRGVGVQVIAVGDTTCGKPVGFLPAGSCGRTYSVVNFEAVNDRNEGRYFDGFDATCSVAEEYGVPQGDARDPLLATAVQMAGGASCPTASEGRRGPLSAKAREAAGPRAKDFRWEGQGGGRGDMLAR